MGSICYNLKISELVELHNAVTFGEKEEKEFDKPVSLNTGLFLFEKLL